MPLFYRLLTYTILFSSIRMLIGGYSSLYLINHGLSIADISFLKAFQGSIIVLIQIPIGYIIDRYKNRFLFVLLSIFLSAIWLFLTGISNNAFCFYTAELFNGISLAIFNAVMLPILVETYTHETGKNDYNYTLGKFFKYQNLLMAMSVILGSIFVNITSRYVWQISALLLLGIGVFSILSNDMKKFRFSSIDTPHKKAKVHFNHIFTLVKSDNLAVLFLANIALITIFQLLAQFWQIIIYDYLGKDTSYALVYGLFFSIILILQAVGSYWAEKKDSLHLSLVFMFLLIVSMGYLTIHNEYSSNKIISMIFFLTAFILFKYPSVIISALLHKNIGNDIRSTFDSIISTLSMVVSIVIFCGIGVLLKKFGNDVILLSLTGLSTISFICMISYLFKTNYKLKNKLEEVSLLDHSL